MNEMDAFLKLVTAPAASGEAAPEPGAAATGAQIDGCAKVSAPCPNASATFRMALLVDALNAVALAETVHSLTPLALRVLAMKHKSRGTISVERQGEEDASQSENE